MANTKRGQLAFIAPVVDRLSDDVRAIRVTLGPGGFLARDRPMLRFDIVERVASAVTADYGTRMWKFDPDPGSQLGEESAHLAALLAAIASSRGIPTGQGHWRGRVWATGAINPDGARLRQDVDNAKEWHKKIDKFLSPTTDAQLLLIPHALEVESTRLNPVLSLQDFRNRTLSREFWDGVVKVILVVGGNELRDLVEVLIGNTGPSEFVRGSVNVADGERSAVSESSLANGRQLVTEQQISIPVLGTSRSDNAFSKSSSKREAQSQPTLTRPATRLVKTGKSRSWTRNPRTYVLGILAMAASLFVVALSIHGHGSLDILFDQFFGAGNVGPKPISCGAMNFPDCAHVPLHTVHKWIEQSKSHTGDRSKVLDCTKDIDMHEDIDSGLMFNLCRCPCNDLKK